MTSIFVVNILCCAVLAPPFLVICSSTVKGKKKNICMTKTMKWLVYKKHLSRPGHLSIITCNIFGSITCCHVIQYSYKLTDCKLKTDKRR